MKEKRKTQRGKGKSKIIRRKENGKEKNNKGKEKEKERRKNKKRVKFVVSLRSHKKCLDLHLKTKREPGSIVQFCCYNCIVSSRISESFVVVSS